MTLPPLRQYALKLHRQRIEIAEQDAEAEERGQKIGHQPRQGRHALPAAT